MANFQQKIQKNAEIRTSTNRRNGLAETEIPKAVSTLCHPIVTDSLASEPCNKPIAPRIDEGIDGRNGELIETDRSIYGGKRCIRPTMEQKI